MKMVKDMKKKRKLRRKRILILISLFSLVLCFVGAWIWMSPTKNGVKEKLEQQGYQTNEIELITNKLSKNQIEALFDKTKDDALLFLLKVNTFQKKNLKRYQTYQINNKTLNAEEVVASVNENLDKYSPIYHKLLSPLIKEKYYIKANTKRYLAYADKFPKLSSKEVVTNVNSNLDYDFYTDVRKTDMSKKNLIITNKYYQLESNYVPELVFIEGNYKATKDTTNAYLEMKQAAKTDGENFRITSAYRSYQTQNNLYNRYKSQHGFAWAEKYSARPGYSEHQTGLALDIITNTSNLDTFEDTSAFQWLKKNSYLYGFILRYPENKEYITGYNYEPWHYRYVGKETAKKIYEENITYEEYYEYYLNQK